MGIARYCLASLKAGWEMLKRRIASADQFYELEEFISSPYLILVIALLKAFW